MEIILKEDIDKLGQRGDVVKVADGFGRNYLLPRGLAMAITTGNLRQLQHEKRVIDLRHRKERTTAEAMRAKVSAIHVTIVRKAGDEDVLYGSVTNADIADALAAKGASVDKRKVLLKEPIKALGRYQVAVKLHRDVQADVTVTVVKEE